MQKFGVFALLAILLASGIPSASFDYVAEYNGSNDTGTIMPNMTQPIGLAYHNGKLYASDWARPVIFVIDEKSGALDERIGAVGAAVGKYEAPKKLFIDNGTLFISDTNAGTVWAYDTRLKVASEFLPRVWEGKRPVASARQGNDFFVLDALNNQVVGYDFDKKTLRWAKFSSGTYSDQLSAPSDIEVGGGRIFIADDMNNRVLVFDSNWTYVGSWGTGRANVTLSRPSGISYSDGKLYVADSLNNRVVVFGSDGFPIATIGGEKGRGNYKFNRTSDVLVVNASLYVADYENSRIVKYAISDEGIANGIDGRINQAVDFAAYLDGVNALVGKAGGQPYAYDFSQRIANIREKISAGEYGTANDYLDSLFIELEKANLTVNQKIRLTLQGSLDGAKARLVKIGNATLPSELDAQRNSVKNRIVDVQAQIDGKKWVEGTAAWQALSEKLGALEAGIADLKKPSTPSPVAAEASSEAELAARAAALEARLAALQNAQKKLNYSKDYTEIETLIQSGAMLAANGNAIDANISLAKAQARLSAAEKEWEGASLGAKNLGAALNDAQAALADAQKWEPFGANLTSVREKLSEAKALIYTDPIRAKTLLEAAASEAGKEGVKGSTRALAAGWLASAILGIIIVGVAVGWAYQRKKRGA